MTRDTHAHLGHNAGLVYKCLEKRRGPMSVMDVAFTLRMWPWDVLMAFGWLAREEKVRFHRNLLALMAELVK
jgi:hypothetical protein